MTVHKAKGLEFDAVFLPELNEGEFPVSNMGGRKYWHVLGGTFEENREKYQGGVDEERKLIFQVKKWHSWSQYGLMGRNCETRVQDYIYLSDTKAAMRNCNLEWYAQIRGTDAQTLRDTVLTKLDLDPVGKKIYDLGGRKVQAALTEELTLALFDLTAGKAVKSMPKKDADPALHEAAKKDLALLKKEIKNLYKERSSLLFKQFLNGKTQKAETWRTPWK